MTHEDLTFACMIHLNMTGNERVAIQSLFAYSKGELAKLNGFSTLSSTIFSHLLRRSFSTSFYADALGAPFQP